MIIEGLLNLLISLISFVFSMLPALPGLPEDFMISITTFFDFLTNSLGFFYFFIRPSTVRTCLGIVIVIEEFHHIYSFVMFIVRKIPLIGVE